MTEYIEREAVIERLANLMQLQAPTARKIIEAIPAADVVERCKGHKCPEQKRGKWINVFDIGTVCNQCGYDIEVRGYDILTDGEPNFCPNCGADMREES